MDGTLMHRRLLNIETNCKLKQRRSVSNPGSLNISSRLCKEPGFETLRRSSLLTGMVCGRGSGHSQFKSVSGTDRARLCGHVKLSLLNSAAYPEYPDRKVGVRACATSSAFCGLCPRQSFHSKGSD